MLIKIAIVLLLFWVAGLVFHLLGMFINIALVLAVILFVWHLVKSKKNKKTS